MASCSVEARLRHCEKSGEPAGHEDGKAQPGYRDFMCRNPRWGWSWSHSCTNTPRAAAFSYLPAPPLGPTWENEVALWRQCSSGGIGGLSHCCGEKPPNLGPLLTPVAALISALVCAITLRTLPHSHHTVPSSHQAQFYAFLCSCSCPTTASSQPPVAKHRSKQNPNL